MLSASELRNGTTFEYEGNLYQVVEFQHVKPGKGSAFVRVKMKNIEVGGVVERTFNPSEKLARAVIIKMDMEYLYNDGETYYFMNTENYDQVSLPVSNLGDSMRFVKENETVRFLSREGRVFSVEPPNFVILKIIETSPPIKSATASNVNKPATVETGAVVNVPSFIEEGEEIRIDTRTGEYIERASKPNI